jgi:hypothetical protein
MPECSVTITEKLTQMKSGTGLTGWISKQIAIKIRALHEGYEEFIKP